MYDARLQNTFIEKKISMARREPVTRKMVAEEAGVSVTIVSYVVNDNRYVNKDKKQRVLDAIKKLGYRPNAIAQTLKSKRSYHILFIADQIDNEHFGKLLFEMDSHLSDKGYLISLAHSQDNDEFITRIISRQFDGVIISSLSMREQHVRAIADAGIPVVLLMNRSYTNLPENVGKVFTGLYQGARTCVKHLYDTGCRNILYVDRMSSRGHFSDLSDLRLKGYIDEMASLDLPFDSEKIITGCVNESEVIERITEYIKSGKPVDAIFARNDRLAAVAMHAVKKIGLLIPDEISVIGFDNSTLSHYTTPSLTTVDIDRKGAGQAAVNILQEMIVDSGNSTSVQLETSLILRKSTK